MNTEHYMDRMQTTSDVLNRAADLIEERGWARGVCAMDAAPDAPLCLEGAIGAALGVETVLSDAINRPIYSYPAIQRSAAYAALVAHLNARTLWMWNDMHPDGSRVIEVLRACAVIESARERQSVSA